MSQNSILIWVVTAAVILGCPGAGRADKIIKTDGSEFSGLKIKWFGSRKEYQVDQADGSMLTIPADEVRSVQIAKPAEFDKAVQACTAKQYEVAIPILEEIISRYKRLQWDGLASELLAKAYLGKGDFKKATQVLSGLMEGTARNLVTDDQYNLYWTALAGAQMNAVLKQSLTEAIAGESRPLVAFALIKRGDMSKADGKRDDAALDYLRSILMYADVVAAQPEALSKAAQLFDDMRDPRAEDLKKRLRANYPDSPYARKLGG
jgi:predicted negative regulator of RcsB-dependent stress response